MLPQPQHSPARYVAMKDSWSHGDDRRDRGRVDRGVTRSRRSRSPATRRPETDREPTSRDRGAVRPRSISDLNDRPRERSQDRRRRPSRSPLRDSREEVRERNRGRELLDTRGSDKPKRVHHSPSGKRRKSRSPSTSRSHHKKSRRGLSRSPSRVDRDSIASSRPDRKRRDNSPLAPRRRSPERRHLDARAEGRHKHHRESGVSERRGRSRSPKRDRGDSSRPPNDTSRRNRSPRHSPARSQKPRERSPFNQPPSFDKSKERDRNKNQITNQGRRSPGLDHYERPNRTRQPSPRALKDPKSPRGPSPTRDTGGRPPRDDYRRDDYRSGKQKGKPARPSSAAASGANSIEVKADKMAGRGFYGSQQGYNPNQQMQAAFPLKAQYVQSPQVDPRQYSQSPQHQITPHSYHNSPQAQSPYGAGRGNWGGQQQQYSPQP